MCVCVCVCVCVRVCVSPCSNCRSVVNTARDLFGQATDRGASGALGPRAPRHAPSKRHCKYVNARAAARSLALEETTARVRGGGRKGGGGGERRRRRRGRAERKERRWPEALLRPYHFSVQ